MGDTGQCVHGAGRDHHSGGDKGAAGDGRADLPVALASPSTLCRLEHRTDRQTAVAIHELLFEQFVKAHDKPPRRLILDFDATDTPLHGDQEGRFFHGYYDHYCFLPLYVFCGRHLLVSYLRRSNNDPAGHTGTILSLLVSRCW